MCHSTFDDVVIATSNLPKNHWQDMIGEKLGRYTILESIGSGSMGTVYRAEDSLDGRIVAVKLVRANVLYDVNRRERFLQGLLAASTVHHPGIAPILEIGDDEDDFFIITPYLKGETLAQLLRSHLLDWRQSLRIAISIGEAVSAVHAVHAVHRALKPSNIWVQSDGRVIVTDCCVGRFTEIEKPAKARDRRVRTESADTIIPMSALAYMSPEQVLGLPVDSRSDIFSLGVMLYEMLTGRHPFESRNSFSRMSAIVEAQPMPVAARKLGLPLIFDEILSKSLAKKPSERYQCVADMLQELRAVSADTSAAQATPLGPIAGLNLRIKSSKYWILAVLTLIGIVAVLYRTFSK